MHILRPQFIHETRIVLQLVLFEAKLRRQMLHLDSFLTVLKLLGYLGCALCCH